MLLMLRLNPARAIFAALQYRNTPSSIKVQNFYAALQHFRDRRRCDAGRRDRGAPIHRRIESQEV
jgi:hypothetical protein